MRFCSLGSGSRGNATLVEAGSTRLLIDCGYSVRELEKRLRHVNVSPDEIDALLITHEHGDHVRGANAFARKYRVPVWASQGTLRKQAWHDDVELQPMAASVQQFTLGDSE